MILLSPNYSQSHQHALDTSAEECNYQFQANMPFLSTCKHQKTIGRSTRPEVFCKKSILENFTKFTGKHLSQSLFLINLQG